MCGTGTALQTATIYANLTIEGNYFRCANGLQRGVIDVGVTDGVVIRNNTMSVPQQLATKLKICVYASKHFNRSSIEQLNHCVVDGSNTPCVFCAEPPARGRDGG